MPLLDENYYVVITCVMCFLRAQKYIRKTFIYRSFYCIRNEMLDLQMKMHVTPYWPVKFSDGVNWHCENEAETK